MIKQPIAYFSMEVALDAAMPTYAGGLSILASDTLRTTTDLDITMIGITRLYRHGYFRQQRPGRVADGVAILMEG